jgi:hypothetical protein
LGSLTKYSLLLRSALEPLLALEGTEIFHGLVKAADILQRPIPGHQVNEEKERNLRLEDRAGSDIPQT